MNGREVHINRSQFLVLCKEDEKLAGKSSYNFGFTPFVSEISLFKYRQKVQFELSARNHRECSQCYKVWDSE